VHTLPRLGLPSEREQTPDQAPPKPRPSKNGPPTRCAAADDNHCPMVQRVSRPLQRRIRHIRTILVRNLTLHPYLDHLNSTLAHSQPRARPSRRHAAADDTDLYMRSRRRRTTSNASTRTLPKGGGGKESLLEPLDSNSDEETARESAAPALPPPPQMRRPSLSYRTSEPRFSGPKVPNGSSSPERPKSLFLESTPTPLHHIGTPIQVGSPSSFPYPSSPTLAARRKRSASRVSLHSVNSHGSDRDEFRNVEQSLRERLLESFVTLSLPPSTSSSDADGHEPFFVSAAHPASMDPTFEVDPSRFLTGGLDWKGTREGRLRIQVWVKPGDGGNSDQEVQLVKGKLKAPAEPVAGFKVLVDWDVDLGGLKNLGSDVGIFPC
jgi:hypothetical protein